MQLYVTLLLCIGLSLPLYLCEKKELKKHLSKMTKTKIVKNKNGKRWMPSFAQNFMNNEPEQTPEVSYNQYGNSFASAQQSMPSVASQDPYGYGIGDPSLQGLEELKIPKQSYSTQEETPSNYAQEVASYLKPGIGDYPSDMPAGMKGYDPMHGIGMPVKQKSNNNANPMTALIETAMTDAALNPYGKHKSPSEEPTSAAIMSDPLNSDEVSPAKVTPISPSKGSMEATSSSSDLTFDNNSKMKTEKETPNVSSNTTSDDKSEKTKEKATSSEKTTSSEASKVEDDKSDDKNAKTVEIEQDESASSHVDSKDSKSDKSSEKNSDGLMKSTKHKTETGERRQSWNTIDSGNNNMEPVGLPSSAPLSSYNDRDDSEKTTNVSDGDEDSEPTPNKMKAKLVSSLRQALLENVKEMMNNGNENEDTEDNKTEKDGSSEKENGSSEKENGSDEKGFTTDKTDEDRSDSNSKAIETDKSSSSSSPLSESAQVNDESKTELLEENLMKIDKKKLVHLLATLMKKNRDKDDEDSEEGENKTETKQNENKQFHLGSNKLHEKGSSRHSSSFDPYAQIGLADPTNNDKSDVHLHTGRHSVHDNHDGHVSSSKESGKDEAKEEAKEEGKSESKNEKEPVKSEKEATENEKEEKSEKLKDAKEAKEKEKQNAKEEEQNVEAEVEKERQELKKLKEEEEVEKAKEDELKASNSELEEKQNKNKKENNEKEEKQTKLTHGSNVHVLPPELIQAIAEHIQTSQGAKLQDSSSDGLMNSKVTGDSKPDESDKNEKESEKSSSNENESKDNDTPNIEELIAKMKQKLMNPGNKNKSKEKSSKRRKGIKDDVYASIGSRDPNAKRRGVEKRSKKHHVHRPKH